MSYVASLTKVMGKLRSFGALPVGWHYGSGGPIVEEMLLKSESQLRFLHALGFTDFDVFPGADGEIMVSAYGGAGYVDVTLRVDGNTDLVEHIDGKESVYREEIAPTIANLFLLEAARECITSGSFTPSIMITGKESSKTSHSKSQATERVFLSFSANAFPTPARLSATTSANIILTSEANRLFSGPLMNPSYRLAS